MNEFSVLISIYYKESPLYFREALDSVFAQTLQPAEIVLVKDGSLTPELDAVIEEYSTRRSRPGLGQGTVGLFVRVCGAYGYG